MILHFVKLSVIIVSVFDLLLTMAIRNYKYPYVAALLRPVLFVLMLDPMRECFKRYMYVVKDSLYLVSMIAGFVFYFAWLGKKLFYDIEEVEYFSTYADAAWSMLILLTTTNFPDIMLAVYS